MKNHVLISSSTLVQSEVPVKETPNLKAAKGWRTRQELIIFPVIGPSWRVNVQTAGVQFLTEKLSICGWICFFNQTLIWREIYLWSRLCCQMCKTFSFFCSSRVLWSLWNRTHLRFTSTRRRRLWTSWLEFTAITRPSPGRCCFRWSVSTSFLHRWCSTRCLTSWKARTDNLRLLYPSQKTLTDWSQDDILA